MQQSIGSAIAFLIVSIMSGCSVLLDPADRCSVDDDCESSILACQSGVCVLRDDESTDPYVLTYSTAGGTLGSDSLHIAYSEDGLHWQELNSGRAVYTVSGFGTNHVRDPHIFRKNDGTFVYMATDATSMDEEPSGSLFLADSTDLITFTNPRLLRVAHQPGPNATEGQAWSPEAFFDFERQEYALIWSGNDATGTNRIYVSYTTDFVTLVDSTSRVFFDPGYSAVDATIVHSGGRNFLFFKDDTDDSGNVVTGSGQDVQIAGTSDFTQSPGSFMRLGIDYITRGNEQEARRSASAPMLLRVPDSDVWFMCAQLALSGGDFGCWRNTDLDDDPRSWTELSGADFSFPFGALRASVVRVPQAQLDALVDHYGVTNTHHIRTTATDAGEPTYMAQSLFHGMVTTLDDRSDTQVGADFIWRVVPGLNDPSNPDLVSFQSVAHPERYLRIDSANPSRYVGCPESSNRNNEACNLVPFASRNHLAWLDPFEDTLTFRSDATFRRTAALNGDGAMSSYQWVGDSTRYLRHLQFQIFAHVVTDNAAASFTLEELP